MDKGKLALLVERLERIAPDDQYLDDSVAIHCCRLSLDALEQGNYGVAAVLLNPEGDIVAQAENRVFSNGYNSGAHAEMLLIDQLEKGKLPYRPEQLTMLVSLEPCPMCLARILLSGLGSVRYMAADKEGGMLSKVDDFPPAWRDLGQIQNHYHAHVSPAVRQLAHDISIMNLTNLRQKLFTYIRP